MSSPKRLTVNVVVLPPDSASSSPNRNWTPGTTGSHARIVLRNSRACRSFMSLRTSVMVVWASFSPKYE